MGPGCASLSTVTDADGQAQFHDTDRRPGPDGAGGRAGALARVGWVLPRIEVTGAFQITSIEYAGTFDGEATYEMSLTSAGAIAFVAAL